MEEPVIQVVFNSSKSLLEDCPEQYYNRFEYEAYLLFDERENVLIGKGIAVLYLYAKALFSMAVMV